MERRTGGVFIRAAVGAVAAVPRLCSLCCISVFFVRTALGHCTSFLLHLLEIVCYGATFWEPFAVPAQIAAMKLCVEQLA